MIANLQIISVFRFSAQLFVCLIPFIVHKARRQNFVRRILLSLIASEAAIVLMYYFVRQAARVRNSLPGNVILLTVYYFSAFLAMTALVYGCFQTSWTGAFFAGIGAYAVEHIAFAATRIIVEITGLQRITISVFMDYMLNRTLPYVFAAILVYILLIRRYSDQIEEDRNDLRILVLSIVLMFSAIGLSVANDTYGSQMDASVYQLIICPAYSLLCSLLVLIMAFYLTRENYLQREQELMEELLKLSNAQHESSKEAIDIINIKCHDLKHQVKVLASANTAEDRDNYIKEIRDAISIYDATYHTGNEPLDYVLREKSLLCEEYGIAFSCMVDGKLLNDLAMSTPDVYALFGNILDNALEAVKKIPNKQDRMISLQLKKQGAIVFLHAENTSQEKVQFVDGLPITTKSDYSVHGFGTKSIRHIAEKYDGILSMRTSGEKFLLDILFN